MTAPLPIPTTELNTMNEGANFWRYDKGMNVIPAVSKEKQPIVLWKEYQDKPISQEQHEKWIAEGAFRNGFATIQGKVWHNRDLEGYYLNCIDADNALAIQELFGSGGSMEQLARQTIVELHKDNPNRIHWYAYTIGGTLREKTSDIGHLPEDIDPEQIPAFEVKPNSKYLSFPSPNVHKNGYRFEIVGTNEIIKLGDIETRTFQDRIDNVCKKYGLKYNGHRDSSTKVPIADLFKPGCPTQEGHNRHERLLRTMDSLIANNSKNMSEEQVKSIAKTFNTTDYLSPPLNDSEFEELWKQATSFIAKNSDNNNTEENEPAASIEYQKLQENWSYKELLLRYEHLKQVTKENMPKVWTGLEFALSVKTTLNVKGNTLPFPGILLGPSSGSKTVIIEMFKGNKHVYYLDSFSPKSFVSHNSSIPKEKLKDVDLLPKLKDKLFLVSELAPIFSAKDDEVLQVMGILTRVVDGQGYQNHSGAQGYRGYNEKIMFSFIGASVDIPYKVHKILGTLGPKLYFFRLPREEDDENHYFNIKDRDFEEKIQEIRTALHEYLEYFDMNPEAIVESNDNQLPKITLEKQYDEEKAYRIIIKVAKVLARLRAIVDTWGTRDTQGSDYAFGLAKIEDPGRAITQLANLARGHALSKGRKYITLDDIPIVIHTALSTATMES